MDDSKNLIMAVALSVAVLFVYQFFFAEPLPPAPDTTTEAGESAGGDRTGPGDDFVIEGDTPAPGQARAVTAPRDVPRIPIDTPRVGGSVSLMGGKIDDIVLKDYQVSLEDGADNVRLLRREGGERAYYAAFGWATVPGAGVELPGDDTLWRAESGALSTGSPLVLTWENNAGIRFRRTITVDEDYMFTVTDEVVNTGGTALRLAPYAYVLRRGTPEVSGFFILHEGPLGVLDGELREVDYDDLREDGPQSWTSDGGWLGITDKYWLAALVPGQGERVQARFSHRVVNGQDRYRVDYLSGEHTLAPGQTLINETRLFAGAKEVDLIDRYEVDHAIPLFDRAIDWGWFYFLTRPIFYVLDFFFGLIGNFGVAILLLTVVIKLIFFPLANKSYVAMSKMKKLAPKMKDLRERYADDKVRQQQEVMELYRKEKVNPLAGCLPILVQIPVFFALYKTLFVTIEMRHQPFFGWIQDLSAPDPLWVTNLFGLLPFTPFPFLQIGLWPVIMGLTMYLQQKLNPQSPDPIQAKVFMVMPFLFVFLFAPFPAGLVIYWTWNNILSILQQWTIMRRMGVSVSND